MYHMVMREVTQRAEQRKCKGDRERWSYMSFWQNDIIFGRWIGTASLVPRSHLPNDRKSGRRAWYILARD